MRKKTVSRNSVSSNTQHSTFRQDDEVAADLICLQCEKKNISSSQLTM